MLPDLFGNKGHKRMQKLHKILKAVESARKAIVWDGLAGLVCFYKFHVPVAELVPNDGGYFMKSLVGTGIVHSCICIIYGLVSSPVHSSMHEPIYADSCVS